MSITSRSFVGTTLILLAVGFAALLAIVGSALWLADRTETYAAAVTDVRRARAATVDMLRLVQDAETGQRGFLLTGDESYLAPYTDAVAQLAEQEALLRERAALVPGYEVQVTELFDLVGAKLDELRETVDLARSGRREEALAIVRTDRGKALMDRLRTVTAAMIADADARFAESVAAQQGNVAALQTAALLGCAAILVVAAGAAWTVRRYTAELDRARGAIQELNAGLEERVRDRTVDLRRANDEIQRFAYIVTHDLRAPLVNIMGFTTEMETSLDALKGYMKDVEADERSRAAKLSVEEDVPEALGFIRASTRKMDGLINAILKLSRDGRRPLKPEKIELKPMLEGMLDAVRHQLAEAQGTVSLDVKQPTLVSDRMTLEQAFGNLLDNAVKYRDPGRPLAVTISTGALPGNRIRIDVADNGRGIAEADHERVFELFRRSGKQDMAGEGIGLAHVRSGIRNLGGDITVASELGRGTTFTVTLPRSLHTVLDAQAA